tara:strand:+ start:69 stop:461 length:393 start_codon:yes stop_codon:yes gene_type:complete
MKNELNNSSYADYLKDQLALISSGFILKAYKRANEDEWGGFIKGTDLRIQIQHKKKCLFEFIVEGAFWHQRNTNKEDRVYMRRWANQKIQMIKNAQTKKKQKEPTTSTPKKKSKGIVSTTQNAFEKMKKK